MSRSILQARGTLQLAFNRNARQCQRAKESGFLTSEAFWSIQQTGGKPKNRVLSD